MAGVCPRCERPLQNDGKCPSCGERKSDRLGDATLGRIADLAGGWSLEAVATTPDGTVVDADEVGAVVERDPSGEAKARALSDTLALLDQDTLRQGERAPAPPAPRRSVPPPIPKDAPPPRAGTVTLHPGLKPRDEDTAFDPRSPIVEPPTTPLPAPGPQAPRGVLQDVVYVWNVFVAALIGRREIAAMKERLAFERAARERRLAELAKAAAADPRLDQPILAEGRARLKEIDEDAALQEQAVTDAEAEARRAEEALTAKLQEIGKRNVELEARTTRVEKEELSPLEAAQAEKKKAFEALKAALAESQRRLAALEKKLARATVSEPELRNDAEADLAAARAEKEALVRDEPAAAGAVTDVEPKVEAARKQRDDLRAEIKKNKEEAAAEAERLEFQAKAARGRRGDAERATKAIATRRDAELVRLGETIDRERPRPLLLRLRPADEHAAAVAILERRILELEDAARAVDRAALRRGIFWLSAGIFALFALIYFLASG